MASSTARAKKKQWDSFLLLPKFMWCSNPCGISKGLRKRFMGLPLARFGTITTSLRAALSFIQFKAKAWAHNGDMSNRSWGWQLMFMDEWTELGKDGTTKEMYSLHSIPTIRNRNDNNSHHFITVLAGAVTRFNGCYNHGVKHFGD